MPLLFETGRLEISCAALALLFHQSLTPDPFIDRHRQGDWGMVDEWLHNENNNAIQKGACIHPITSRYLLQDGVILLVITSRDRSYTRMQLSTEYEKREVGVQEGYAVWAATYDSVPNPLIQVEEPHAEAFLDGLCQPASAVDVGTGTGRLALKLARRSVPEVAGYDASQEMLNIAKHTAEAQGLSNVCFQQAILGDEPLPASSDHFDLLVSGLMLCHLSNLRDAIRECVRVVKPGGHLFLSDFHPAAMAFGWRSDLATPEAHYLLPNPSHTRQDYLDALTEADCEILSAKDIALGGEPYGEVTPKSIEKRGLPPLCLIITARKWDRR